MGRSREPNPGEGGGGIWGLRDNVTLPFCLVVGGDRTPVGLHDVKRGCPSREGAVRTPNLLLGAGRIRQ